ncbi:hypothetical protein GPALN_014950 [Globodera pallida]|nr:hypothetical protein GPALN_014950 [Globodera pallida]
MRVTVMNRLRALRRQKAREEMPHDAPTAARVATILREELEEDDCWEEDRLGEIMAERSAQKLRYQESGVVHSIVAIGDVFQLDNKPFVIPKGVEEAHIAEQWLNDRRLV